MASMVKTYMMLCIAGLVVTVCILMVMYNGNGSDVKDMVVKVDSLSEDGQPNSLRGIKGTTIDEKTVEFVDLRQDKTEDYSDDGDDDDEEDEMEDEVSSSYDSSDAEDAWLDQEKKLMEKPEQGAVMRLAEEDQVALQKSKAIEASRTNNIRIVGEDEPQMGGAGGIGVDTDVMRGDTPVMKGGAGGIGGNTVALRGDIPVMRGGAGGIGGNTGALRGDIPVMRGGAGGIGANTGALRGDIPVIRGDTIPDKVRLNQDSLQVMDTLGMEPIAMDTNRNRDVVQPAGKTFKIMDNGDLMEMDASKKEGGDNTMVDMRISGSMSKFKTKYDGGVQDLLRHPQQHMVKETKKDCQPKNNIVMVKTHKCSSSTMQNILFRWGENNNLTFAFPSSGVYLGSPSPFTRSAVMESNNGHYNIIANHLVFNQEAIEELMPADSVYIALLRNPATQYESMYNYYRFDGRYRVTLEHFLKRPRLYFESEPHFTKQVGRNPMLFDIGLDARQMEKGDLRVSQYIQQLGQRFDVVLIAEYFKESLILLKDILCWDMDDVVFFNQNARSKSSVRPPTESMKQRIRSWNNGDDALYQYFNRTLWKKIEAFGYDRMAREVAELDRRNAELSQLCIGATRQAGDSRMYYPPGVNVKSFVLNQNAHGNHLCEQMTRPELTYIGVLRQGQIDRDIRRAGR